MAKTIYLDYAATTPVDTRVLKAMTPYFSKSFGNASSLHTIGQKARAALENARKEVASLINAEPEEIVFTSGGTESDNLAIKGVAFANKEKKHIITSSIEHMAVMETVEWLERQGWEITILPVDKFGLVDLEKLKGSIRKDTLLVSIMHANNEIGTIENIKEIGKICHDHNVLFHTDAVQTFGKIPIDVKKMNVDLLSASSHKIYGPKGVGCLYVRKGTEIEPILHGGGQESGLRSTTENVAGIIGFAETCRLRKREMKSEAKRLEKIRDKLIKGVLKIEESHLNGHPKYRLPNNANFRFSFIEGESLITQLDFEGVEASTGSACSTRTLEPSHVLLAIGLKPEEAHGSLRLTLGKYTKDSDINYVLRILPKIVKRLRTISPFKGKWE
jgi:cysteine desulfurase